MPSAWDEVYRRPENDGAPRMSEADATAELLERSGAMRRQLLWITLTVSFVAGAGTAWLYISTATRVFGLVIGVFFSLGALLVFGVLRVLTGLMMRGAEAAWAADLADRNGLSRQALKDALRMLR